MDEEMQIECDSKPFTTPRGHQYPGQQNLPLSDAGRKDEPDELYYNMQGKKLAIIINMKTFKPLQANETPHVRHGSDNDLDSIQDAFIHLGFQVEVLADNSREDLMKALKGYSVQDYKEYACLAVIIMTHGDKDVFYCVDWMPFTLKEVEEFFLNSWKRKPKLFFVQACRGTELTEYYARQSIPRSDDSELVFHIPKSCDVLEFYSTEDGKLSARPNDGSWFIQSLASRLKGLGHNKSLLIILTKVINDVMKKEESYGGDLLKQQPVLVTRLAKSLQF